MLENADVLLVNGSVDTTKHLFMASRYLTSNESGACLGHFYLKANGSIYDFYPCHCQGGSQSTVCSISKLVLAGVRLLDGCLTMKGDDKLKRNISTKKWEERQSRSMKQADEGLVLMRGDGRYLTVSQRRQIQGKSPSTLGMIKYERESGTGREFQK